ncbi:MAG TPA: transposase, partial [Clostridiaceae bacterium]|nr:transposase [Clostridiaceae bacterium]
MAIWNNQNYSVGEDSLAFPLWINGKATKTSIKVVIPERQKALLENKKGTLRITKINGKYIAQIAVDIPCESTHGSSVMGIDMGLKVPAVAVTDMGKTRFFGNGRENKYKKRMARVKRKALGKAKKIKILKKLNNKEQRWMRDKDHKLSREIVNFAKANNVSTIQLEDLAGIRQTAR